MPWTDAKFFFFHAVTILGDSGFLLPASAILFILLWASGSRRAALGFAGAMSLCVMATVAAKLGFTACGAPGDDAIRSPSGHASLSAMFFSSVGFVAVRTTPGGLGRAVFVFCLILVALIAGSRIVLYAHTVAETLIGLSIGAACFLLFRRLAPPRMRLDWRVSASVLALFVMVYALFGRRIYIEERLTRFTPWIQGLLGC
jgi:undecaprenyl-diphosphatase